MTLLGKLFRPWDLSTEDASITIENEEKSAVPDDIDVVGEASATTAGVEATTNRNNLKMKLKRKINREKLKLEETSQRSKKHFDFNVNANSESANIKFEQESNSGQGHLNNLHNCCEPISPADFDLHLQNCNCNESPFSKPENMFMYPTINTINELASLSRTELTAMGLLPLEPLGSMKVKRQRPKRFHCPHCQVAFSNNGQLNSHVRIHTGERPFECLEEGCGKSFTRNEELTRHRRIHSGLRPFPCSYCGKKFGRKDHLKKHTRTHQRGMFGGGALIGYGNPFHQPFIPPLIPTSGFPSANELISIQQSTFPIHPPFSTTYPFPL